jgi:hypothetical protein
MERSKREAKTKSKANKRKIKEGRPKKEERNEVGRRGINTRSIG